MSTGKSDWTSGELRLSDVYGMRGGQGESILGTHANRLMFRVLDGSVKLPAMPKRYRIDRFDTRWKFSAPFSVLPELAAGDVLVVNLDKKPVQAGPTVRKGMRAKTLVVESLFKPERGRTLDDAAAREVIAKRKALK